MSIGAARKLLFAVGTGGGTTFALTSASESLSVSLSSESESLLSEFELSESLLSLSLSLSESLVSFLFGESNLSSFFGITGCLGCELLCWFVKAATYVLTL